MQTSPSGIALIKHFEGFAERAYLCPAGYPTIGYGHVVRGNMPGEISEAYADRLLAEDLRSIEAAVRRLIRVPLSQNQFDVLVSFTFNLGAGRLQMSRLRMLINRGDYAAAAPEFLRWVYGGGRKLPGLVARRRAEAALWSA